MRRAEVAARSADARSKRPVHEGAHSGFVLYSRRYCHLCDEMLAALRGQLGEEFPIAVIDVDEDPGLAERYGELVPVLVCGESEVCRYHHDAEKVAAYIGQSR